MRSRGMCTLKTDPRMPAPAAAQADMPAPATAQADMPAPAAVAAPATATALILALSACQVEVPTATRDELVKTGVAVEVIVPFDDFVASTIVYGGYGRASQLGGGFVAHEFGAGQDEAGDDAPGLEAATLVRFGTFPRSVTVTDTAGTNRPDSAITFHGGGIVIRFDSSLSVAEGPVEITAHTISEGWDPVSASWTHRVDTIGAEVPWSEPGGGVLEEIGSAVWDPAVGDTVEIMLDSALIVAWSDTAEFNRDIHVSTTSSGVRLRMSGVQLRLQTIPTIRPDTLVLVPVGPGNVTFIYDPLPAPPKGGVLRVGGAPAWRSFFNLDIPHTLTGYASVCAQIECPVEITPDRVSYAGLQLTAAAGSPAFTPSDTLTLDVRMVTAPDFLPRSPLGPSGLALSGGARVPPELFLAPEGQVFEIPITEFVRDQLRGESLGGTQVTSTLAIMSIVEPLSINYATFGGRSSSTPPTLRLILNFSRGG